MSEIIEGIDLQVEAKISEHSKFLNKNIEDLKKENELLKTENLTLQNKLKTAQNQRAAGERRSQLAVKMANYNEQYSRKNNIKILNIKEYTMKLKFPWLQMFAGRLVRNVLFTLTHVK